MNEVNQLRKRLAFAIVAVLLLAPVASAHGANSFSFIMRNSSVAPDEAGVQQNDTLVFYNVVNHSRTLTLDNNSDGVDDWVCEVGPSDSMSTDDECYIWLDPEVWEPRIIEIQISQNDTHWMTVLVEVIADNHTETGPPDGGFVLPGGGQQPADSADEETDMQSILLSGAILAFGAAACLWILKNVEGSKESSERSEEE